MNNKVKISQLSLLLLTIVPGGKYLSLPSILAQQVGRDSWIVVGVLLLFDVVCLSFLLWAINNNVNMRTFPQILYNSIGKVLATIVFVIMWIWIAVRMITLIVSIYKLFTVAFSIKTNWLGFIIPLIIFMLFLITRGFRNIARLNEIFAALVVLGILSIIIAPLTTVDKSNLLPILSQDSGNIWKAIFANNFWFSDYAFLYFVLGDIVVKKRLFSPILASFGGSSVLTVLMNMLFITLYGSLASQKDIAMSKVSQFSLVVASSGRIDWLSLTVWTVSIFVKLTVLAFCLYKCTEFIFQSKKPTFSFVHALPIVILSFVPMFVGTDHILEWTIKIFNYPFIAVKYVLPLLMPLLVTIANNNIKLHQSNVMGEQQ